MALLCTDVFIESLESRVCLAAPTQWLSRGPGGGGAFFAPSFSPFNSSEMYVVTDMSGVFHSADTGASWQLQDFRQVQGNRPSRVQFTSDPNLRYILDTFPIVKRDDDKAFGRYRTADLILAYMNALEAGDTEIAVAL